jgi:archaellum component FlaC
LHDLFPYFFCSSVLNSRRGSVVSIKEPEPKKVVIVEEKKDKKGLKSIQAMVDALTSKLTNFEKQFQRDQEQILHQNKEISELKENVKDILEG